MAALRRGIVHYAEGDANVPAAPKVDQRNFEAAHNELKLSPQEQFLYQMHLQNLHGPGGVDNANGSRSTLFQAVHERDGKYFNIPTVWNGKIETEPWTRPDGTTMQVPNQTALANVANIGWDKFPSYADPNVADERYHQMHVHMERDTGDYLKQRNDAMAPQLKRGVAHYAEGDEDTAKSDADFVADRAAKYNAGQGVTPIAPAPAARPPFSSFNDMVTGNFGKVTANPDASAFSSYLAGVNQAAQNKQRAQDVSMGPSAVEKLWTGFFGDRAGWEDIKKRDATSKVLSDPLVRQHLVNTPDHLAAAERDPHAYAAQAVTPEFRKVMETAVAANAAAAAHPKVTPDEHQRTVEASVKHDVPVDAAHIATSPTARQKYTIDDFVNTFKGIPTATFMQLFGAQLQHVRTPQEKGASEFFDRLHGAHADASKKVHDMIAEDQARRDKQLLPIHTVKPFWGPSPLDAAKAEQASTLKDIMEAIAAHTGISQKPYQIPGSNR